MIKALLRIGLSLTLISSVTSCGAVSSLIPRDLDGKYRERWSFCIYSHSNQSYCEIYGEISNSSSSPIYLSGCFYAVVDGKTYPAEETNSNTGCVADTVNPGETLRTGADFVLPSNKTIDRIFVSNSSSEFSADFVMKVGRSTNPD